MKLVVILVIIVPLFQAFKVRNKALSESTRYTDLGELDQSNQNYYDPSSLEQMGGPALEVNAIASQFRQTREARLESTKFDPIEQDSHRSDLARMNSSESSPATATTPEESDTTRVNTTRVTNKPATTVVETTTIPGESATTVVETAAPATVVASETTKTSTAAAAIIGVTTPGITNTKTVYDNLTTEANIDATTIELTTKPTFKPKGERTTESMTLNSTRLNPLNHPTVSTTLTANNPENHNFISNSTPTTFPSLDPGKEPLGQEDLIPIIVGSILGGTVILILIAYLIARCRSKKNASEETERLIQ